jgi:hypothetical protein
VSAGPRSGTATETVLLSVPADPDYLAVVRSGCAQVGTKLGYSLTEVSDLRLAVDEICGLLLRRAGARWAGGLAGESVPGLEGTVDGNLECRFLITESELRVVVGVEVGEFVPPTGEDFGWAIVTALVDDIRWHVEGLVVRVEILKRRPVGG